LARIKLKIGENEIEVDSRDFYVDNQTIGEIIDSISNHLPENQAKIVDEDESFTNSTKLEQSTQSGLEFLDDAEVFEPEFNEPKYITSNEIKSKLRILETSKFFDIPKTVTEIVQQLREYGWATSPLDVSKTLAKMASTKEIMKNSRKNRTCYYIKDLPVVN
jgi:orotidine-5'-phosphate decarboxylase